MHAILCMHPSFLCKYFMLCISLTMHNTSDYFTSCSFKLTLKLIGHGLTDGQTDIVRYKAAIAAENSASYAARLNISHKRKGQTGKENSDFQHLVGGLIIYVDN
jgi:hypothetical protein